MTSTKLCTVTDCGKPRSSHGLCQMHARRVKVHGDLNVNLNAKKDFRTRLYGACTKTATCWLWTGTLNDTGYGITSEYSKSMLAHRASYTLAFGAIPAGLSVLHRCDVPACINPAHLFLGTRADNVADMVAKNRNQKGETNGRAVLTEAQVRIIKTMLADGATKVSVAEMFEVSRSLVSMIGSGKRWKHV